MFHKDSIKDYTKSIFSIFNLKSSIKLSFVKGIGILCSIGVMAIIVRELEPKNVGIYFLVFATAKLFSLVFSLGSFAAIIPMYSSANRIEAHSVISLSIISSILMALFLIIFNMLIFSLLPDHLKISFWYIPIATILGALLIIQTNLFHIYSAKSKLLIATFLQEGTGRNIIIFALMVILLIIDDGLLGLRSIFAFIIFSSSLLVILGLFNLRFSFNLLKIPRSTMKIFFKLTLNFAPSTIISNGSPPLLDTFISYIFGPISLAAISIANRVCEVFLFFTHMINLYFVKASKIFFEGKMEVLNNFYLRSILVSFVSTLVLISLYLLFGYQYINSFLGVSEIENAEFAILLMLISTIGQSIAIFSLTFFRNIGRYKFVIALDSFNLAMGILLFGIGMLFPEETLLPIIIIVSLRIVRQCISFLYLLYLLKIKKQ